MRIGDARTQLLEQTFFQKVGAALKTAYDKMSPKDAGNTFARATNILQALTQISNDAIGRGLKIQRPQWSIPHQKFYIGIDPKGPAPATPEEFAADPMWKGSLAAWMTRAKAAGYVMKIGNVGGMTSLLIDPKDDLPAIQAFYQQQGFNPSRDAQDPEHRTEMSADELMTNLVNHKVSPWQLDEQDLLKLYPGQPKDKALDALYQALFASKSFGAAISPDQLSQYFEYTSEKPGLLAALAANLDLKIAKQAAIKSGIEAAAVEGAADTNALLKIVAQHYSEKQTASDPTARKGVADADLIKMLRSGKLDVDQLDKEDRTRVLKALGVIRIPTDPKKRASMIADLIKRMDVSRLGDSEIFDAVVRQSYKGAQVVATLTAQLGAAMAVKRLQTIIRQTGAEPVSADPTKLGQQLDSLARAKRLAPPPPPPAPPGKKGPKPAPAPVPMPAWVPQVQTELAKLVPSWKKTTNDARTTAGKKAFGDKFLDKTIAAEIQKFVAASKKPPTSPGDFFKAATSILAATDGVLATLP